MLYADPNALDWLVKYNVKCNEALAEYGSITVMDTEDDIGEKYSSVGVLGVLNALLAEPPFFICCDMEEGEVCMFRILEEDSPE